MTKWSLNLAMDKSKKQITEVLSLGVLLLYLSESFIGYLNYLEIAAFGMFIPFVILSISSFFLHIHGRKRLTSRGFLANLIVISIIVMIIPLYNSLDIVIRSRNDYFVTVLYPILLFTNGYVYSKFHRNSANCSIVIMFIIALTFGALIISRTAARTILGTEELRIRFAQGTSDSLILGLLLSVDRIKKVGLRFSLILLGLVLTITVASYASVFSFVMSLGVLLVVFFRIKNIKLSVKLSLKSIIVVVIIGILFFVLLVLGFIDNIFSFITNAFNSAIRRTDAVLFKQTDRSLMEREILLSSGISQIQITPLLGKWKYYAYSTGNYIHNFLSWFAEYGLFSFIYVICVVVFMIHESYRRLRRSFSRNSGMFLLALYIAFQVAFSRSYGYYDMWLAFGVFMGLNLSKGVRTDE